MLAVTGATGNLGGLVVQDLLDRGVDPANIVAAVRSPDKASELADRGVNVRKADYNQPDTLISAFEDIDRLLLISSSEVGQRAEQHRNVVEAAEETGVGYLAYTSMVRADSSPVQLASEHEVTENIIRGADISYTFLRNGWYIENYTENLDQILERGAIYGSAEDGRISGATREDYAAAAATVLTEEGHEGNIYELGGDEAFTMQELADEISRQSGTDVVYRNLPMDEYAQLLKDAGLPEPAAETLADADAGVAKGYLYVESDDLRRLIGRPTTPLPEAVARALPE